jgi:hypothetical protein
VNQVLDTVFDVLKLDDSGTGFLAGLATVWNFAVELAQQVITGLIKELGEVVFAALRTVIAAIASLSMAASLFVPYGVTWSATPAVAHFQHPGEPPATGRLEVAVSDANVQWAKEIIDCAALAGIDLPEVGAAGKGLTWTLHPLGDAGASVSSASTEIDPAGKATLVYGLGSEDGTGQEDGNGISVSLEIEHLTQAQLSSMFDTIVLDGEAGKLLATVLGPQIDAIKEKIAGLMDQSSTGFFFVGYHREEPTPTPPPSPSSPPTPSPPPTPRATLDFTPATARFSVGSRVFELRDGTCRMSGGQWSIVFVQPDNDYFSVFINGYSGPGAYGDSNGSDPGGEPGAFSWIWDGGAGPGIVEFATLEDEGTYLSYTGPARGSWTGRAAGPLGIGTVSADGTFDCFGELEPSPSPG